MGKIASSSGNKMPQTPRNRFSSRLFTAVIPALTVVVFAALAADSYRNAQTVRKLFGIGSGYLLLVLLVLLVAVRRYTSYELPRFLYRALIAVCLTSLLLSTALTFIEYVTPDNYVFDKFRLNNPQLLLTSLGSGALLIIFAGRKWLAGNWHRVLFVLSLGLIFIAYLVSLWPFDAFARISQEDNIIENMQFIVLAAASVFAYVSGRNLWFSGRKLEAVIYLGAAIILFFVAGDEIAWGQRIIGLETPEAIAVRNKQNEITWHNLNFVGGLPQYSYILFGLYGSVGWIPARLFRIRSIAAELFIVPWYLSGYFFVGFYYNYITSLGPHWIGVWSEFAELMLYLGVMWFFAEVYRRKLVYSRD